MYVHCASRNSGFELKKKKKAIFLTRIYPVFREGKRNIYFPDIGAGSQASDCNSTKSKQTVNRERGGREKKRRETRENEKYNSNDDGVEEEEEEEEEEEVSRGRRRRRRRKKKKKKKRKKRCNYR